MNSKRKLSDEEKNELYNYLEFGNVEKSMSLLYLMEDIDDGLLGNESSLNVACSFGNRDIVNHIISLGGNVNKLNDSNYSPLMVSVVNECFDICELLISHGADVNHCANPGTESALSLACSNNCVSIVKLLIQSGVDINEFGDSALFSATYNGDVEILQILIDAKANVNAKDDQGATPLHHACCAKYINIIQLLLDNGADESIKNNNGEVPLDWARSDEVRELVNNYNSTKYVLK